MVNIGATLYIALAAYVAIGHFQYSTTISVLPSNESLKAWTIFRFEENFIIATFVLYRCYRGIFENVNIPSMNTKI
jgi:hypothetical protein